MRYLDSLQSSVNSATAAAGRAPSTLKLKSQMNEPLKRRQGYAAQLGASLYEATKDNPELRAGREALFDSIAACDAERAQLQAQIDQIEAEAAAAEAEAAKKAEEERLRKEEEEKKRQEEERLRLRKEEEESKRQEEKKRKEEEARKKKEEEEKQSLLAVIQTVKNHIKGELTHNDE